MSVDRSVTKVSAQTAPRGPEGQKYLAAGISMGMRLWENEEPQEKPATRHDYETLGYVISGRAELTIEGQTLSLEPGDSYAISRHQEHSFRILEPLTAVEVTHPPAFDHH